MIKYPPFITILIFSFIAFSKQSEKGEEVDYHSTEKAISSQIF